MEKYERLLKVIEGRKSNFPGVRDYCVVSMILSTGTRVSEVSDVNVGDLSLRNKAVKLHRKGGEQHMLLASEELSVSFRKYPRIRRRRTRTRVLFISTHNTRMLTSAVWKMIKSYCRRARISKDRIGPHTLATPLRRLCWRTGRI